MAMGQLGYTSDEFWDLTPREFWNALDGFFELKRVEDRNEWERCRWQTCWLLNIHIDKNKRIQPRDLVEFEWDKGEKTTVEIPTREEFERLKAKYSNHG